MTKDNYTDMARWAASMMESEGEGAEGATLDIERRSLQIAEILQRGEGYIREGLLFLQQRDAGKTLMPFLQKFQKINSFMDQETTASLFTEEDYSTVMSIILQAFEQKEYEVVQRMVPVATLCFPTHIQPYILLATTEWALRGVAVAIMLYEQLLTIFNDPLLSYYAADCYASNNDLPKARALATQGLALCKGREQDVGIPELMEQLKQMLAAF